MSLHRNVIANFIGQGWVALMSVAFVPLYIQLLGISAYGLIGVFAVLQTWLALLDMGLALALNREMARFTAGLHDNTSIRDLLRSVEVVCLVLAVAAGVLLAGVTPSLASGWLQTGSMSVGEVQESLYLMALIVGWRLLEGMYHGAVLGLQSQVAASIASALLSTFRWGGAALALVLGTPSVSLFFTWQVLASVLGTVVFAVMLYRRLPAAQRGARFSSSALHALGPFAGGVVATTLLGLLLTQLDKVVLSRLLSLESFGYYALAAYLAGAIQQLIVPIAQAYYPRLSQLVAAGDEETLARTYHEAAQLVTVLIAPAALLLILYGEQGLRLWTSNPDLAAATAPLLCILAAGSLLNGCMSVPYNLQLAHGWSQFAVRVNLVAVLVFVPALLWVAPRYLAVGAAWLWVALNLGYFVIGMHFMHRRLLPREKWTWYGADVLAPLGACGAVMYLLSVAMPHAMPRTAAFVWLVGSGSAGLAAAVAAAPRLRRQLALVARLRQS